MEIGSLRAEVKSLRDALDAKEEVAVLSKEVMALRQSQSDGTLGAAATGSTGRATSKGDFAAVVRKSVQTAIKDEKCKCEVIISKIEEKGEDDKVIEQLCETLDFKTKPLEVIRIGRKEEDDSSRQRLMKVTFANQFEARTFRAKYDEERQTDRDGLPKLRMRAGRNEDDQALFRKLKAQAHKMNADAKAGGDNASFSVRDQGVIWKFKKNGDGKWVRDRAWSNDQDQGNGL